MPQGGRSAAPSAPTTGRWRPTRSPAPGGHPAARRTPGAVGTRRPGPGRPRPGDGQCGGTGSCLGQGPGETPGIGNRERWGEYAQALIDGETVRAAARRGGVHQNTSFRWRHRCLALPAEVKPTHRHGIVAADKTYFLESHQGERHLSRPPRQRGGTATQRGLSDEQIPVRVVRDRSASTTAAVRPQATPRP